MELLLLRHSITPGNLKKQYVGITDQPLAPEGEALAREKQKDMPPVEALWISPCSGADRRPKFCSRAGAGGGPRPAGVQLRGL